MRKNDFSMLPSATARAIEDAMDMYGTKTYEWLAHLWEPEIGGFYYSNSGRDYEGFLPDIESTCQALHQVQTLGMMDHCGKDLRRGLPIEMQKKVLNFAQSLQAEDGFFYHPQWGREIPVPRKGRDYEWGRDIITELGGEFKYPLVADQIKEKGTKTENLPEYMKSKEALVEYLDSFDIMHNSYRMGGTLGCQLFQIRQLGMLDICLDYYKDHQNKNNGVWQDSVNYHAVNGLMKIAGVFVTYGPFPNYDKAIDSCMEVMLSEEVPKAVVDFFNPWRAALEILDSLRNQGMEEEAAAQQAKIMANSAALINKTSEKMRDFIKPDGSVSYFRNFTSSESQRVKVALYQEPEGDVNATGLAIGGSIKRPLEVLGVKNVGLYDESDFKRFLEIIEKQKPPVKKPRPEGR